MAEAIGATQFLLFLHSVPQVGEKTLAHVLRMMAQQRCTPEQFLALSPQQLESLYELDQRAVKYLLANQDALKAQSAELARIIRSHPIQVLTFESATYPPRLERNDDFPPPLLYALGNASLLDAPQGPPKTHFTFTIAVSNGAPPSVLARQDEIATELVVAGGIPVTGHDRTPYKRLALAAQRRNRPILYVFDRGLREALGPEFDRPLFAAARIRDAVFEPGRDLAVSPFRLDDHGLGANNRRRDRLVFALSDLIVALDVQAGGGMEAECRRAQEQGRPVFIVEGGRSGNDILRTLGCRSLPAHLTDTLQVVFEIENR